MAEAFGLPAGTFELDLKQMYVTDSSEMRKADQLMISEYGFPGLLLMETAGRKAAEWILAHCPKVKSIFILAGPGNNGGDGLVIARYLHQAGRKVEILLSNDPKNYQGDALSNWKALQGSQIPVHQWPCTLPLKMRKRPEACIVIDALLGTGITDKLRGTVAEIIAAVAQCHVSTIAIDLPSGLSADTGERINTPLKAEATLTFQCPKLCHYITPAAECCGDVVTLDIGIWPKVLQDLGIRRFLLDQEVCCGLYRQRPSTGHKGTFGHALLVGGSKAYAGAIALSGMAALQSGAGLASIFTTESARCAVLQDHPELMVRSWGDLQTEWLTAAAVPSLTEFMQGKSALAVGPGLGNEPETCNFLQALLQAWGRPLVIDADALNILSSEPELWRYVPQGSILTPHPGEMARLLPGRDVHNRRLEAAEFLAQQKQVIVVLKGAGTVVAFPDGKTYINTSGNAGMATGGAGDVLTGMIVGLLAQGYTPAQATLLGVHWHGRAGDFAAAMAGAPQAVTASVIAAQIGFAIGVTERKVNHGIRTSGKETGA